eukprot:724557_1
MQRIGQIFETSIFENDDYIITGTWTLFSLCDPLIRCMAKNRKPMEKTKEQFEQEKLPQRNNANSQRRSPHKSKKKNQSKIQRHLAKEERKRVRQERVTKNRSE